MVNFKSQLVKALATSLLLKLLTFALSTYITRRLLPSSSGVGYEFIVYVDAVLFVGREAIRNIVSKYPMEREDSLNPDLITHYVYYAMMTARMKYNGRRVQEIISLSMLVIPLCVVIMAALEVLQLSGLPFLPSLSRSASLSTSYPGVAEASIVASVLLTAAAEPMLNLFQLLDLYHIVLAAEYVALAVRLLVILFFVVMEPHREAITLTDLRMIYALGHMASAVALLLFCFIISTAAWPMRQLIQRGDDLAEIRAVALERAYGPAASRHRAFRPQRWTYPYSVCAIKAAAAGLQRHAPMAKALWRESLLRLVLTEAESFSLTSMTSLTARGYYQLITNLGSMVARLVFRVWENACTVRWSRDVVEGEHQRAADLLRTMLRLAVVLSYGIVLVGPPAAPLLLSQLYTSQWALPGVVGALQLYCYLLPIMALNGLLEAYHRAVATPRTMKTMHSIMLAQSILYAGACYGVLTEAGLSSSERVLHAASTMLRSLWGTGEGEEDPNAPVLSTDGQCVLQHPQEDRAAGHAVEVLIVLNMINLLLRSIVAAVLLVRAQAEHQSTSYATAVAAHDAKLKAITTKAEGDGEEGEDLLEEEEGEVVAPTAPIVLRLSDIITGAVDVRTMPYLVALHALALWYAPSTVPELGALTALFVLTAMSSADVRAMLRSFLARSPTPAAAAPPLPTGDAAAQPATTATSLTVGKKVLKPRFAAQKSSARAKKKA